MTQRETHETVSHSEPDDATDSTAEAAPEAPEPEPWTPERVTEWNAYYDLYVVLSVLLLCFIASANKITNSSLWNQLQVGRQITATSAPMTVDRFSYTEGGKAWVNVPWLVDAL